MVFDTFVMQLQQAGFFNFIASFFFVLAASYGILNTTKILGGNPAVDGTTAVALAFLATGAVAGNLPATFFPRVFGGFGIVLAIGFGAIMIVGLTGGKIIDLANERWFRNTTLWFAVAVMGIAVLNGLMPLFDISSLRIRPEMTQSLATVLFVIVLSSGFILASLGIGGAQDEDGDEDNGD